MLAFLALTKDEPPELALDYLKVANARLGWAMSVITGPKTDDEARKAALKEVTEIRLLLMGLAFAADPEHATQVNLKLVRRKGRPRRNIVTTGEYRQAARHLLARKADGYDAAAREVAQETGLDRTEIEAWASHLEKQQSALAVQEIARFFRSAI